MITDSNFHTHTTYCDGKSTPEEVVLSAINKGFRAIGFSGHQFAPFCTYGMRDTEGYRNEILSLREKYRNDIEIYLGIEEEAFCDVKRQEYDYIIGSSHYVIKDGIYYPVDSSVEEFNKCIEAFGGDYIKFAENYYSEFVRYINLRKPDIIGHFDLITKFDEKGDIVLNDDAKYRALALKYIKEAMKSDCIFEINTGAISRGYRTTPYPSLELLHELKKGCAKIIISADSHHASTLDCCFEECENILRDIGFTHVFTISKSKFIKVPLK